MEEIMRADQEEVDEVKKELGALEPGEKLVFDGKLSIAIAAVYGMPDARGGGLDFRVYDNPKAFGHIIERRPSDAL
jgi:hypothetical protein